MVVPPGLSVSRLPGNSLLTSPTTPPKHKTGSDLLGARKATPSSILRLSPSPLHPEATHSSDRPRASLASCLLCPQGRWFPSHHATRTVAGNTWGNVLTSFAPAARNLAGCTESDLLLSSPRGGHFTFVHPVCKQVVLSGRTLGEIRLKTSRAS